MDRRTFLKNIGITAVALTVPGCSDGTKREFWRDKRPPNIVFIMLDEWGYFEISALGNEKLDTPNIDRMLTEGMRFTQMLAGGCVCAPTRSVLMTGKHTGHTTVRVNGGGEALRIEDVTVAEILKRAGYVTGGFGKWGLGDRGTTGVPEKQGFDVFYGYYHQIHAHSYYPRYLLRNSQKEYLEGNTGDFYEGKTFAHNLIFNEALEFIHSNKDRPFFCFCPWTLPHGLWGFPDDDPSWKMYKDKPWTAGQVKPTDAKVYAAMINMMDRQIGQIMALLEDLDIDEKTIVFVCGDNGGQPYFLNGDPSKPKPKKAPYAHGFFGPNLNPKTGERFRGGKGNLYEGGLRIPFIVRWPGKIKSGVTSEHLCYFADVLPSLAELAGTEPPSDIDGISIVPTLLADKMVRKQDEHEFLYWEFGGQIAVRMGDYKAIRPGNDKPFELYNLRLDIQEKNNVAEGFPQMLSKMESYAQKAHSVNVKGSYLPGGKEKGFKGHKEN